VSHKLQHNVRVGVFAGPQLENILWWGKNNLRVGDKRTFGGKQKYTKYNKITKNLENFKGQDCC